jgi:hypothetical protein
LNATEVKLFFEPKDRLRLTIGEEKSYTTVKPAWSAPLSHPNKYLALLNGKGEEIVTLPEPKDLDEASFEAVTEEIRRRYLTATIQSVINARSEFGVTYWHVATDRGERDFVTQSLQENAQWLSEHHLLLIDVDGNRFEILDAQALDERSRLFLDQIL